jgi:16S rRNA (cytosine967-C5)-methyltransferase
MTRNRPDPSPPPGASRSRRPAPGRTPQDNVRAAAGWVLERTLQSLAPVDSYLASTLTRFDERDQGLLRELVMGSLRWLRRLDQIIADASHRRFDQIEPALHSPLRIAAYQLLFLDRVPPHAAVHEAVEQARQLTHRGGASFVNGVLRRIARDPQLGSWPVHEADPVRRMALEMSHPDFLVERWLTRFGRAATLALLAANNREKPMQLLAFRDRGGRELLAEALIDEGIEVEPSPLSALGLTVRRGNPLASPAFRRGDFYIQDEASQAAAWVPPPRPGEAVLDAAAAPGGKTFALLAREPAVAPILMDVAIGRIDLLRRNLRRLGRRLPVVIADAGAPAFAAAAATAGRAATAAGAVGSGFDRVVADLPCTGTGTLRRHPELKWRISESEIGRLSQQALRLLAGVAPLVRPGGLLVAITCSLEAEENEQVAASFLDAHPDFERLPLAGRLDPPLVQSILGPGAWRVLTGDDHDGFSVSVLAKARR